MNEYEIVVDRMHYQVFAEKVELLRENYEDMLAFYVNKERIALFRKWDVCRKIDRKDVLPG